MILGRASEPEREAAFQAVHKRLTVLINKWVPFFWRSKALNELESERGRQAVLETLDAALDAAEKARVKHS